MSKSDIKQYLYEQQIIQLGQKEEQIKILTKLLISQGVDSSQFS